MSKFNSRQLDLWATALGVSNDTDAMQVLHKAVVRVKAAMESCDDIAKVSADAPDATVAKNAQRARGYLESTAWAMVHAYNGFKRHSRGQG